MVPDPAVDSARFLLTRRALTKRTWPGVWTNSFCGHPLPQESLDDAVRRRLAAELGTGAECLDVILAAKRYRAVMDNGIVENEVGPVVRVLLAGPPVPNADEVDSIHWIAWDHLLDDIDRGRITLSPWSIETVKDLRELGPDPWAWPLANPLELPGPVRCLG